MGSSPILRNEQTMVHTSGSESDRRSDLSGSHNHLRLRGGVVVDMNHDTIKQSSKVQTDYTLPQQQGRKSLYTTPRPKLSRTIEETI
eukprot:450710-Hanusia_phi.AAC.1